MSAASGFACPECGTQFTATDPLRMPAELSCGHTLCAECANAITLCSAPVCTVCKAGVFADVSPIHALAALADSGCKPLPPGSAAASSRAATYLEAACAAEKASQDADACMDALQSRAGEVVALLRDSAARRIADITAMLDLQVALVLQRAGDAMKPIETTRDELVVRASQLRAGAALCDLGHTGGGLYTFDLLACKPTPKCHAGDTCLFDVKEVRAQSGWSGCACARLCRLSTMTAFCGAEQVSRGASASAARGGWGSHASSVPIGEEKSSDTPAWRFADIPWRQRCPSGRGQRAQRFPGGLGQRVHHPNCRDKQIGALALRKAVFGVLRRRGLPLCALS